MVAFNGFGCKSVDMKTFLKQTDSGLALVFSDETNVKPIIVDFIAGANAHRRQYGGGKGQLIARAVGLNKRKNISVLDVTAGLGGDAFVLACLGCDVTMCERSEMIAALLKDGLARANQDDEFKKLKLKLLETDSKVYLAELKQADYPDVIYVDPMFPKREKSALVKKEMRVLQDVVGSDEDSVDVFELAQGKALQRIVVKRPRHADTIDNKKPDLVLNGKSSRFDIYFPS